MRLSVSHTTTYRFEEPVDYALQQLRLTPRAGHGQTVVEWSCEIDGGSRQAVFEDQFSNTTELIRVDQGATEVKLVCSGVVETEDRAGVIGPHRGFAPLWLFQQPTPLTQPGPRLRQIARRLTAEGARDDALGRMHRLSAIIAEEVKYETGHTDAATKAEAAAAAGRGVCQDHAHVMIAAAQLLDIPARYVSGYLLMNDRVQQDASHAWCEVWVGELGWVGFDVSNAICPDDRYVRVATGRDYVDAAPIHGFRHGAGGENLHVTLQVQQ